MIKAPLFDVIEYLDSYEAIVSYLIEAIKCAVEENDTDIRNIASAAEDAERAIRKLANERSADDGGTTVCPSPK